MRVKPRPGLPVHAPGFFAASVRACRAWGDFLWDIANSLNGQWVYPSENARGLFTNRATDRTTPAA